MNIGDFRAPNLHYKGWLENLKENDKLLIQNPKEDQVFYTDLGASKKEITVAGILNQKIQGKILVIIRTDRDYPQALGIPKKDGTWEFSGCTLGGVDHQIYAALIDENDTPLFRSKVLNVRLERKI